MNILRNSILVLFVITAILMSGCKKEEPSATDQGLSNPNPAQDSPLMEKFHSGEYFYYVMPHPQGGYFVAGKGKYVDYAFHLGQNGDEVSKNEIGFLCYSRRGFIDTGEYFVAVGAGGSESAPYDMSKYGYFAVFDHSMNSVKMTHVMDERFNLELNAVAQDPSDPELFYAGGLANTYVNGHFMQIPYLCSIRFDGNEITVLSSRVYNNNEYSRVIGMVVKEYQGQKDLILELIRYESSSDPTDESAGKIHVVKPNYFEAKDGWGHDTWDVTLEGPESHSWARCNTIVADDAKVYCFGFAYQLKEYDGGGSNKFSRFSGLIAAVNWHSGQLEWQNVDSFSDRSDFFCNGKLVDGYLYVCGAQSRLKFSSTKMEFSNGLVAKYSTSGTLIASKTFGSPERDGVFEGLVKGSDGKILGVGWSGENLGNDKRRYDGWFVKTDF